MRLSLSALWQSLRPALPIYPSTISGHRPTHTDSHHPICSSTSFDHTGLTLGATRAGVKVDEDSVTALGQKLSAVGIGIAMIILSAHLNMGSLCFSTSGKRINSTPPSHASLAQSPAVQRAVTLIVFSLSSRWRQHNHCRTTLSCFHVSFFNATDHSSRVANWYLAHDCTHRVRWSQD
jgi:hypothetical protein